MEHAKFGGIHCQLSIQGITLPCLMHAVTINATSSPRWRSTFLKTSVIVILGTSNSGSFSIASENTVASPSPAKYDD